MKHSTFYKILFTCFFLIIIIFLYERYYEPYMITVKEQNVIDERLPESFYGYKVVQLSDIYYKSTIGRVELEKIVKKVNKIKPDIIVITGDLLDKKARYTDNDINNITEILSKIECKYKYIITGDNDKVDIFDTIVKRINFKSLDNTYEILYNNSNEPLLVGGLSTRSDNKESLDKISKIDSAIKKDSIKYNILFMHEPSIIDEIDYSNYNLILAGHTLNGQINIPFIKKLIIPSDSQKYTNTHYRKNDTNIYISPGLGTAGFKARMFNKPTINLYRLLNK